MDKLKKCSECNSYTLEDKCKLCKSKTESAHYKFLHLTDAKEIKEN